MVASEDPSNGYEAIAERFMSVRSTSGQAVVRAWAMGLDPGSTIVDVGAGSGKPLTSVLIDLGLNVSAIDAAPSMVAAFKRHFPDVEVSCEQAERSAFFGRTFDAILAVGLVFLLTEQAQRKLFRRMAKAMKPGGRILFSAPQEAGSWEDVLTGRLSHSLGIDVYRNLLAEHGLVLSGGHVDAGGSYYYAAIKQAANRGAGNPGD
ncbi:MAG: class I SAM-dependent methyltransferase [Pseudomonadota bacterium]